MSEHRVQANDIDLERVLAYDNPALVGRVRRDLQLETDEARFLFEEAMRMLYLIAVEPDFVVTDRIRILDEVWHTFLLHSRDYADFCDAHFGFFLHHQPESAAGDTAGIEHGDGDDGLERDLRRTFEIVLEHFGEETLYLWYHELPARYGPSFFASRSRPSADIAPLASLAAMAAELAPATWPPR